MSELTLLELMLQATLFVFLVCGAVVRSWLLSKPKKSLVRFVSYLLLAFVILGLTTFRNDERKAEQFAQNLLQLRDQYPVLSLEERLPTREGQGEVKLSSASEMQLNEIEKSNIFELYRQGDWILKEIHEGNVQDFARRMGFGVGRMAYPTYESLISNVFDPLPLLPQPIDNPGNSWKPLFMKKATENTDASGLQSAHVKNILDFVGSTGFGFIKGKKLAAGFIGHQFRQMHEPDTWVIDRLELVGLLVAEQPRVYVSEFLPNTEQLRKAKTRSLDFFEAEGLARLNNGEELFYREESGGLRMIGAIRSVKQCLKCHDGQRGELLGAFSYVLE